MSVVLFTPITPPPITVYAVPGAAGTDGTDGADGTDGTPAYTVTSANFVQPAASASVTVSVATSAWMGIGAVAYVVGGGYYTIAAVPGATSVTLTNLNYTGNAAEGVVIIAGAKVVPAGLKGADGAVGSVAAIHFTTSDPNGVVTATRPAIAIGDGNIWSKENAGTNNTGWVQYIAAPP